MKGCLKKFKISCFDCSYKMANKAKDESSSGERNLIYAIIIIK